MMVHPTVPVGVQHCLVGVGGDIGSPVEVGALAGGVVFFSVAPFVCI